MTVMLSPVPVRYLLLGLVLLVSAATPVRADTGLTNAVASAYFPRTVDSGLHAIAHERVAEIAACECLSHDLGRAGTAEVLGWNRHMPNPVTAVVAAWGDSGPHDALLSDSGYGRIGCAELVTGDTHWFACVLASGPLPAGAAPGPTPAPANVPVIPPPDPGGGGFLLPDTALAPGS